MQTWKVKKQAKKPSGTPAWQRRALGAFFLLATLGLAFYDFPQAWNASAGLVEAKTGWSAPRAGEEPFRLGLDLQGGTHLVYEADMSEIPEVDRLSALEGVRDVIERRVNAFGISEPVVQTTSTGGNYRVIIELAGVLDVNEAIKLIGETPILEFKEPGQEVARDLTEEEQAELDALNEQEREQAEDVLQRAVRGENFNTLVSEFSADPRLDETQGFIDGLGNAGIYAPIVAAIEETRTRPGRVVPRVIETAEGLQVVRYVEPTDTREMLLSQIRVCFDGNRDCPEPIDQIDASVRISNLEEQATPENFKDLAAETNPSGAGELGWIVPGETSAPFDAAAQALGVGEISTVVETESGYHLIYKEEERDVRTHKVQRVIMPLSGPEAVVGEGAVSPWRNTELSGKHLQSAAVEFEPNTGAPLVAIDFNDEGGELFGQLTEEHVGSLIAIFLDGEPISTPVVNQPIYGGQAVITGDFALEEAKLLAQRLNAGALPVPIDLLSQQTVGPTLGAISLEKSITAALWGFLLIAVFMVGVYRLPGLIAVVALVLYAFLNLAAYRFFGVTVTLAGIAGFVLSLGIAVDANVLILERFREELNGGRDFRSALDEAFRRAWSAIRDGNITTLIAAGVLFLFASSFIKGFALTLSIGVILSMFTAIAVTRVYLRNMLDIKRFQNPALFSAAKKQ